jgi:hypothetical protein
MFFRSIVIILSVSLLLLSRSITAQEESLPNLDEIIEEIASSTDIELDYTTLFTHLESLYYNPINLNTATADELQQIIFLTEFQVYNILRYRELNNGFQTLYELQFVIGLDILTLKRLIPFVSLQFEDDKSNVKYRNALKYGRNDLFIRYQRVLQEKAGYAEIPDSILALNPDKNRYLGSPDKVYTRYSYRFKNQMFWGFTAEKDDGEQFLKGAQKYGFDFYSAHFQINNVGRIKKLVVGDFLTEFGQGLTLWSGMSFGKTSSTLNVIKRPRGINKYSSVNENEFFRGSAITLNFGDIDITGFASYKKIDASTGVDTTFQEYEEYFSSFLNSGYYRTPSEIARKNAIQEFVTGGNLSWNTGFMKIGATGVYSQFSVPFQIGEQTYRFFEFQGNGNANFGIDYITSFRRINLFGEVSMSENLGYAILNGAVFDFVPQLKMSVVHRYYEPDYQALYAQPFSEGNKAFNETGIFLGFEFYPIKKWRVDAYIDSWKHPWLRYGVHGPSSGVEYLLQVNHYPQRNLDMYFRFKYETKLRNNPEVNEGMSSLTEFGMAKYRYHISYAPTREWRFQNRVELSQYFVNETTEWGYMVYQDVQYRPQRLPFVFTLRLALFETESWNTRIYAYEPDILYAFSVPAYYSQGLRTAFVIKYSAMDNLDFWFKFANTYYNNQDGLGSGLDFIEGKNRTDFKLQLRYRF